MSTTPTGAAIPRDPTDVIIDTILRREGWPRYTDRSSDRGGSTKGGITLATLKSWRGRPVIAAEVAALDEAEVRAIYRARYIKEPGFAKIADGPLRNLVIDSGVNHGVSRASVWLREAVNELARRPALKADGKVGPATLAAVNGADAAGLWRSVFVARMRFYGDLISGDARKRGRTEEQALNAAGWLNRLAEFMKG